MKLFAASFLKQYAVHAGLLLVALIAGVIAAQGNVKLLIFILGIFLAPLPILCPAEVIYKSLLLCNFFIVGMVGYFADLQQMQWIPSLLFAGLLVRLPFDMMSFKHRNRQQPLTLLFVALVCFCASLIIAAIANQTPAPQTILGIKHFIFPLAITTLIVYSDFTQDFWLKVCRYIPPFIIVQLPVALYQYFFIAKAREKAFNAELGAISWDAVVGSFGGNAEAGGAAGALALFICFGCAATYALQNAKQINNILAIATYLSALVIIALAETKIVIVYLPLILLAYQRKKILTSPSTLLLTVGAVVVFIPSLLLIYETLHYSSMDGGVGSDSLSDIVEKVFKADADSDAFNVETAELSKSSAVKLWWVEHVDSGELFNIIFGHGLGATKNSATFGIGVVAKRYSFPVVNTTFLALLWDAGIFAVCAMVAAIFATVLASFSFSKQFAQASPSSVSLYEICGIGALLLLVDFPFDTSLMETPAIQTILATIFGIILSTTKQRKTPMSHTPSINIHIPNATN